MKPDLPAVARQILSGLLDRFEQPNRQRVVRVRLKPEDYAEYFSGQDAEPRHETNARFKELAGQGILRLHWKKWEEGNWLEAVDLAPEEAKSLYALLKRTPRSAQEQALRDLLAEQTSRSEWHAEFLRWAQARLESHRSVTPLDFDDPTRNRDLLRALDGLAQLSSPTLERSLSVRLFNDSKRFEELRHPVLVVLHHHAKDAEAYGDDDDALLRVHYLERVPEYVPVAGPLSLKLEGRLLDVTDFAPSVALSAAMLRQVMVAACPASCVVTVENATSFSELAAIRPTSALLVFTGGFASPTVVKLLSDIRAVEPNQPFFHWGDMDAGGLRILAHLRSCLSTAKPLGMDRATFEEYHARAQPLTSRDRENLAQLRNIPSLADCSDLIDCLLGVDQKLEQEAIDVDKIASLL